MRWQLNTPSPVPASKLGAALLAELQHHAKTTPESAARDIIIAHSEEDRRDAKKMIGISKAAEAAAEECRAQLPLVQTQMKGAIEAAVAIAKVCGTAETLFLVTLAGHHDPDYADGIEERVTVAVDVAQPPATTGE